jgi:Flp pilus assembly protein TadD
VDLRAAEADRLVQASAEALAAGRIVEAGQAAEMATRLDPQRGEAWVLLCAALAQAGSADVEKAMSHALAKLPEDDPARSLLEVDRAQALVQQARWGEAAAQAQAAAGRPDLTATAHRSLAATFAAIGLYPAALRHAERAAELAPDDARVLAELASVCRAVGLLAEAETLYGRALAIDPDLSSAHAELALLRTWSAEQNHVAALQDASARAGAGSLDAARLDFALFKELDDLDRRGEAWAALTRANDISAGLFPFDGQGAAARTEALIASYPKARLQPARAARPASGPRPIFIFGLPRSGTTLVERILAAHSGVTPVGETSALAQAVAAAGGPVQADWDRVAALYRERVAYIAGDAYIVVDQLPANYEQVGAMRLAFPDAALVHVRRAPMDCLFGCYRLLFGEGGYRWSYRLGDLAANFRVYRRLMAHWKDALGPGLIELDLEALIAAPEQEIRKLLDQCGLAFEPASLAPEKAAGGVSTASAAQVRAPINARGVGAWRRYAEGLEPLRAALERDGLVGADGEPLGG